MKTILHLLSIILCANSFGQVQHPTKKQWEKVRKHVAQDNNFIYIPTGLLLTDDYQLYADQDVPIVHERQKPKPPSVDSFYISKYEVTNWEYLEYIYWLGREEVATWVKKNGKYVIEFVKKDVGNYEEALPDTLGWRSNLAYNESYVEYYFRHPGYRDYPVVNVSYEQALTFCEWRTQQYNMSPYRTFEKVIFRLPTKKEWQQAALGGYKNIMVPVGQNHLFNERGERLANIQYVNQLGVISDTVKYLGSRFEVDSTKKFKIDFLVGAPSLPQIPYAVPKKQEQPLDDLLFSTRGIVPFGYGLFHMAGNAEEMVQEKGVTLGGSWGDTGFYCLITTEQHYPDEQYSSPEIGFRMIMEVIEAKPKLNPKKMRDVQNSEEHNHE